MCEFSADTLSRIQHIDQSEMSTIVDRLVDVYHPLRIYLFGSHAWGTPTVDSDYDLCVIVEKSDEKKWNRCQIGLHALLDILRRHDIVPYPTLICGFPRHPRASGDLDNRLFSSRFPLTRE